MLFREKNTNICRVTASTEANFPPPSLLAVTAQRLYEREVEVILYEIS